jgi:hypothetical protein
VARDREIFASPSPVLHKVAYARYIRFIMEIFDGNQSKTSSPFPLIHLKYGGKFSHVTSLLRPSLEQSGYWDPRQLENGCTLEQEPCHLEALTFSDMTESDSSPFIHLLLGTQSIIDISNLRTLSVCFSPRLEQYDTMRLARRLGSSLEHLTFKHREGFLWGEFPFFSCKKKILLRLEFTCTDDRFADEIHLGMQHKLRTLTIFARFRSEISFSACWFRMVVDWEGFDRALDNEAFGSLCSVEVLVRSRDSMKTLDASIREFIDQLPQVPI